MEILLSNFRYIKEKKLIFENKFYLLKGDSGSGKTTILESFKFVLYGGSRNMKSLSLVPAQKTRVSLKYKDIEIIRTKTPEHLILIKNEKEYINNEAQSIINSYFYEEDIWRLSSYVMQKKTNIFLENNSRENLELLRKLIFKEEDKNDKLLNNIDFLVKNILEKSKKSEGVIGYLEKELKSIDVQKYEEIDNLERLLEIKKNHIQIEELDKYQKDLNLGIISRWKKFNKYKNIILNFKQEVFFNEDIETLRKELYKSEKDRSIRNKYNLKNSEDIKILISKIQNKIEYDKIKKLRKESDCLELEKESILEEWIKLLELLNISSDKDYQIEFLAKIEKEYLQKSPKTLTCPSCNVKLYLENENLKMDKKKLSEKDRNEYSILTKNLIRILKDIDNIKLRISLIEEAPALLGEEDFQFDYDLEESLKTLRSYNYTTSYPEEIISKIDYREKYLIYEELKDLLKEEVPRDEDIEYVYNRSKIVKNYTKEEVEKSGEFTEEFIKFQIAQKSEYSKFCEIKQNLEKQKLENHKFIRQLDTLNKLNNIVRETENRYMQSKINDINKYLNKILETLFEDIDIKISMFREMKGKEKNKPVVNLKIFYKGIEYPKLDIFSGGEQDRISIALTVSFNILLGSPLLMFDEVFSSLQEEKRSECLKIIKEYSPNKILINTCHETVEGLYDEIISL